MFDDVLRELKKLEQGVSISIELPLDEKGCMDRRCPSGECGAAFKVPYEDWRDKVPDEHAFCPFCGHEDDPQDWNTPDQDEYIRQVGMQHISGVLDRAFSSSARRFNQQQRFRPRNGLINLTMSMQYKPGAPIIAVPPESAETLRQEFACERCACRWSSLGASYFCPACGHNSVESAFTTTVSTVRAFLASVPTLRESLTQTIGEDDADTTIRQLVEDQFGRVVGAFERYSESLFDHLPSAPSTAKKGSVFQRIHDASDLWRQATGNGYDDLLSPGEVFELARFVQQRHVLGHKQGIVDEKYIERSGDTRFRPGQRLVIRPEHIERLVDLVERLGVALKAHSESVRSQNV